MSGDLDRRALTTVQIHRYSGRLLRAESDRVAREEPLEIRLGFELLGEPAQRSISVTMRTPGDDEALAVGFLFAEGLIDGADDIASVERCPDEAGSDENILRLQLAPGRTVDLGGLQRNFYTTSSCGVCGKASLQALEMEDLPDLHDAKLTVPATLLASIPGRLRRRQSLFEATGGVHAAGLFDLSGQLVEICEDVGRHNAMDKLVGRRLIAGASTSSDHLLGLSGRASFELLQKALRAQIPLVVAVGAPSSLAVDLAHRFGVTLVGFAREDRFNVYTHPRRIADR